MPTSKSRTSSRLLQSLAAAVIVVGGAAAYAGCSQPPPIVPKGAIFLRFVDDKVECNIVGHDSCIGDVDDSIASELVLDDEVPKSAACTNGDKSAAVNVSCSVVPADNGYAVELGISQGDKFFDVLATIDPEATDTSPSKGTFSYKSVITSNFYQSTECEFFLTEKQYIEPGKLYISARCPHLLGPMNTDCSASAIYMAFESCESL